MLLLPRQSPTGAPAGPPPVPPMFDPTPYETTPLLNQRTPLLALTITFIAFSWICSLLRLYARFVVQRAPGWDDFFIILTMLSTTTGSIALCIMTDVGMGKPIFALPPSEIQNILKLIYLATFTYPLSHTFIKIALLLQYLRLFTGPRIRMFCKSMLVLNALVGLAFGVCSWFPCYPVAAFWDISIKNGRCWGFASRERFEFMRITVTQVIVSATFDLIVFLIPARLYFRPETPRATRLSLLGLFVLGLSVMLCSLWRVGFVIKLSLAEGHPFDPTWDNPTVMGLISFEVHLAAVCAALPVFWPVLKTTWKRVLEVVFVTYEVSVTKEYGVFPSKKANDIELQSASAVDPTLQPEGWEPFVGDETTGLGENETVVESLAMGKRSKRTKDLFRGDDRS